MGSLKTGSWRGRARHIVSHVLKETAGQTDKEIREALYKAYPFGVRANHPYHVWLNEIKRQRGLLPSRPDPTDENQLTIF